MTDTRFADIVVGTDGSEPGGAAVETAYALAAALGARVHPCTVVDPYPTGQRLTDLRRHRAAAADLVDRLRDRADRAGVDADPTVREGRPHAELTAYAAETDADLIVVGTHGRGGARRALLGSVAEKLIRTADVPVLVTHEGDDAGRTWGPESRLLVATDGSDAARPAERVGVGLAASLDARLAAVSVVDEAAALSTVGGGMLGGDTIAAVKRALDERADRALTRVSALADDAGVDADSTVLVGEPGAAIRDYAADTDTDLIVVGTHGRGGIRRVVIGSIAERVIRGADRPVLVVPARAGSLAEERDDDEDGDNDDDGDDGEE
ncbi:universal stress protein [Halobaculum lipolyticum]|uniref:Universal stress protein n=1 Tax=Halobaculum lipolyticum TaxID=3032001 RepID=A0ABD5WFV0_9EURY|nr:universal stress protein [Halobaculum sp. DT31]